MRVVLTAVFSLVICLAHAARSQAGLYNTEEFSKAEEPFNPAKPSLKIAPKMSLVEFKRHFNDLRGLGLPKSELRKHYLKRLAELEEKERQGSLTVEERVNLSAYYLRLGNAAQTPEDALRRFERAVEVLSVAANERNFMVLANLALANYLVGRLDRAIGYQEETLAVWPTSWPGLSQEQLYWHRRVEKYFLTLLQLRHLEQLRPQNNAPPSLYALFPKVRFIGPDNQYAAGQIAFASWAELPRDAPLIVEQLLLSLPSDFRLYWLLGELLNAEGDIPAASEILNFLVEQGYGFEEIQQHRRILNAARPAVTAKIAEEKKEELRPSWLPDWRYVTVSFFAGAVVALLAYWQVREIRRRYAAAKKP